MMHCHPHPGEVLREDVLSPLGLEITEAARCLGMSRVSLSRVINEQASISPRLAIRLERAGVSTARFWMTLQTNYALSHAAKFDSTEVIPFQRMPISS